MAETTKGEASPPPRRPFRALLGPSPDRRRTMGGDAFTQQLWAPRSGAQKLPCQGALAHSTAPVGRWPREGSEGP
eukprot:7792109-Alexandrium_andersonii.AAC.1